MTAKEIREAILTEAKRRGLEFEEEKHRYYINNDKGERVCNADNSINLPSVSKLVKRWSHPFIPEQTGAFKKCGGDKEKEQALLQEWRDKGTHASHKGSMVHYELELDLIERFGTGKEVRKPDFVVEGNRDLGQVRRMIQAGKDFNAKMQDAGYDLVDTELVLGSWELGFVGQPDKLWVKDGRLLISDWKGLPIDTPIITPKGWKQMGELEVGGQVFDKDGRVCNIKHTSTISEKKCYEITFDNNEKVVADHEHRWLVYSGKTKGEKVVRTTEELFESFQKHGGESFYKFKIDNAKPLEMGEADLPIDPYVLGAWLADGSKNTGYITQMYQEIWDEFEKRGYELGRDVSQGGCGKAQTRVLQGLRTKLRELGILADKDIPFEYLVASKAQRLDLLRGFMDGDGYFNETRNRFVMETTNEKQVDFFYKLCSTLGLKVTTIPHKTTCNGKTFNAWSVGFSTDEFNPFLCRNKDVKPVYKKDKRTFRSVKSVVEVSPRLTKCIEVDSPSSTFLCGKNLLVTHNTNKKKSFTVQSYTKPMLPPFETHPDISLTHYFIQLSLYRILIEDMVDCDFLGGVIVHLRDRGAKHDLYSVPDEFYHKTKEIIMG